MKRFDYSFLKTISVPASYLAFTSGIYQLKTQSESLEKRFPNVFTGLRNIAIVESVKGSNAIEGIVTSDQRIRAIVEQNSAPLNHNEQEIAGYRDALNYIHQNYHTLSISEGLIKQLHSLLLGRTALTYKGSYKTEDNVIRERRSDGSSFVRWMPTSAIDTPKAMEQLVLAYVEARDDSEINPLLLIPCFILDFLCIHPFRDGNGRMSRLLSLFLLYKSGFDVPKYISFEEQINKEKWDYYNALKASSEGWHENQNDYVPFIGNFLKTLFYCYQELDKRFLTLRDGKVSKKERIEQAVLTSLLPLSKADIQYLLPDVSVSTIEAVLSEMVKSGKAKKIGSTRGAKYIKS